MKKIRLRDLFRCQSQIVLLLLICGVILYAYKIIDVERYLLNYQQHFEIARDDNFISQQRSTSGSESMDFNRNWDNHNLGDQDLQLLLKQVSRLNDNKDGAGMKTTRPSGKTVKEQTLSVTMTPTLITPTYPEPSTSHYFFLVLVLSHPKQLLERKISRKTWNNETYFRSQGVSLKILYLLGRDVEEPHGNFTGQRIENDMIITDVFEHRDNLTLKLIEGLRIAQEHFSFEYVLKTDIDVFNNYTRWQEKIRETILETRKPVLYGGGLCVTHIGVPFKYCSGLGYVLHHSLVSSIVEYPLDKIALSEDLNTGKVLWEMNITFQFGGSAKRYVIPTECWENPLQYTEKRSGEIGYRLAAHTGSYMGFLMQKRCWYRMQCRCKEIPWDWDPP